MQLPTLDQIDAELARRSLSEYIKQCWSTVEPGQPYVHGWHVDALSEHLMAVTDGQINRLLINVPPGTMKSLQTGVFWPSWEWGPRQLPHYRYLAASHSQSLSIRDNIRMRRLVMSDWYQKRYGQTVVMTKDQNAKIKFENTATGFREAMAAGSITGSRGDRVIIDDPLSVEDANSDAILESRMLWFTEAVPTRLNSPEKSAIIVVMQRLTQKDTSGIILARELGYVHVMLPMEFEVKRKCFTCIGFEDPRTEEGELLFPERFPRNVVERDKVVMGPYATAGQFQQRPSPREGGIFKRHWFKTYKVLPRILYVIQSWDTAFKKTSTSDYSACTTWGVGADGNFYLLHVYMEKMEYPELKKMMVKLWKQFMPVSILIEDKASGQSLGQEMKLPTPDDVDPTIMHKLPIKLIEPDGDKIARAHACTTIFEINVYLPEDASWKERYTNNMCDFPGGAHDDDVDSTTQALIHLSTNRPKIRAQVSLGVYGR